MRKTLFRTLTCTLLAVALGGCGLVYHPVLQQGNLVNKKTVAKLKPGMTKRQVVALMGTPSISSPFDHKRWDYVHEFAVNGGKPKVRTLTLFFNNGTLVRTQGSLFHANNKRMLKQSRMYDKAGVYNGKNNSHKSTGEGSGG